LRALRRDPVDRPPIWLMRQAGRYLPEYRALRKRAGDFLTLCRTPELAVEAALQPVRRFGFDAAILFSDILIPAQAMGAVVTFEEGEGPRIGNPVRSRSDVAALCEPDPREAVPFVFEAVRSLARELRGTPLIGFAAAPFTLACYLIEGETSRNFELARSFFLLEEAAGAELLEKVARFTAAYLAAQIEAGAEAVQLFDTHAGLLSPRDFRALALGPAARVFGGLRQGPRPDIPLIYFVNGAAGILEDMARGSGADAISVDWRIDLGEVRRRVGPAVAVQGNLDPVALLGPLAALRLRAREVLLAAGPFPGHIMNLGHGVLAQTPIGSVEALVEVVRDFVYPPSIGPASAPARYPSVRDGPGGGGTLT